MCKKLGFDGICTKSPGENLNLNVFFHEKYKFSKVFVPRVSGDTYSPLIILAQDVLNIIPKGRETLRKQFRLDFETSLKDMFSRFFNK